MGDGECCTRFPIKSCLMLLQADTGQYSSCSTAMVEAFRRGLTEVVEALARRGVKRTADDVSHKT